MESKYNNDLKQSFIDFLIENSKNYINAYERLFTMAMPFEHLHKKDLYSFTSSDLKTIFHSISKNIKYNTAVVYNSLIGKYKEWCKEQELSVVDEVCTTADLQSLKAYKSYIIMTDVDIDNITRYAVIDGADYNPIMMIRILWEIDGQEKLSNIVKIKIDDLNVKKQELIINNTIYNISEWLTSFIENFAKMSKISFEGKQGSYDIKTAQENMGYIFRMSYSSRTNVGEPLTGTKLSNMLYQFCERHLDETITVNDILMSLALKNMLANKKTHSQMNTEKRYFKSIPSSVYQEVFMQYAPKLYPMNYDNYVEYYRNLKESLV